MNWRTGRKAHRTIYDGDTLIGMMDTPELAALVVVAVNRVLEEEASVCADCGGRHGHIYPCKRVQWSDKP